MTDNMIARVGLLGSGISKSRMPALQEHLAHICGIHLKYSLFDSAEIRNFDPLLTLTQLKEAQWVGANITHPFKKQIHSVVHEPVIAGHNKIGSYNTIKFSDEKLLGANTDYSGFMRAYRMRFGNAKPGPVLICGAGGVGCAVAFALVELEASEIKLFDIENGTAEKLRRALEAWGYEATTLSRTELIEGMHSSDGLVNCTTLGMHSYPGTAFPIEGFASQRWAFDAVYTPLETQFLNDCRANGLSCLSGFDLWINQGIDAFNIFTNQNMELNRQLLEDVAGWFEEPLTV